MGKMDEVRLSTIPRNAFPRLDYFWKTIEFNDPNSILTAHFNEGTGSITEDSINENPGTIQDTENTFWTDGYYGKSIYFDGTSTSKVTFPVSGGDYILDNEISIEAWVNPVSFNNGDNYIVHRPNSYALDLYKDSTTGHVYLRAMVYQDGVNRWTSTSDNVYTFHDQMGSWFHVGMTYDTTTKVLKTFVNGHLNSQTTISTSSNIPESGSVIEIGTNFKGKIDEVRIYPIRTDFFNTSVEYDHGRVFHFDFNEGSGVSSIDPDDPTHKAVLYNGDEYGGSWITGVSGYGLSLDGSNDYILINDTDHEYDPYEMTMSMYVKIPQALTGERYVIAEKENSFNMSIVKSGSSYYLEVYARSGDAWYSTSAPEEAIDFNSLIGSWVHVAFTLSEGEIASFVNGRFNGRVEVPFISVSNSSSFYLGRDETGNYFKAMIDEVCINKVNEVNNIRYGPRKGLRSAYRPDPHTPPALFPRWPVRPCPLCDI